MNTHENNISKEELFERLELANIQAQKLLELLNEFLYDMVMDNDSDVLDIEIATAKNIVLLTDVSQDHKHTNQ
jgi:hypothetical protein